MFSSFSSLSSNFRYGKSIISNLNNYNYPFLNPYLVLYYPMDISSNVGGEIKTPNYASKLPVYDATMFGSSKISLDQSTYTMGIGDLSLNNTLGSTATDYIVTNNSFTTNSLNGLTISLWFSCSGQLNTIGTMINLSSVIGNGLRVDISGTNTIYSGWN